MSREINVHNGPMPNNSMKSLVERAVEPLLHAAVWGWGRADDLASFQFGQKREVVNSRGEVKTVGEYALHIQCDWRIIRGDEIVVGYRDVYSPPPRHSGSRRI